MVTDIWTLSIGQGVQKTLVWPCHYPLAIQISWYFCTCIEVSFSNLSFKDIQLMCNCNTLYCDVLLSEKKEIHEYEYCSAGLVLHYWRVLGKGNVRSKIWSTWEFKCFKRCTVKNVFFKKLFFRIAVKFAIKDKNKLMSDVNPAMQCGICKVQ